LGPTNIILREQDEQEGVPDAVERCRGLVKYEYGTPSAAK